MGISCWGTQVFGTKKVMSSSKYLLASIVFVGCLVFAQAAIECYTGAALSSLTGQTKSTCETEVTMCKNFTTTPVGGISVTTLACADTGATAGCTDETIGKTCICSGALCNKYSSAVVSVSAPIMIVFTLAMSGLAFVFCYVD